MSTHERKILPIQSMTLSKKEQKKLKGANPRELADLIQKVRSQLEPVINSSEELSIARLPLSVVASVLQACRDIQRSDALLDGAFTLMEIEANKGDRDQ